ncbi:DUF4870 domain-containing protein [Nocardiopsis flavescens]
MSYPNTPPDDPYGQNPQQGGQGQSDGHPAPGQHDPYGGYPAPGQQGHSGGYPAPGHQDPSGGYPPPGYQDQSGGYPAPGQQGHSGGYPPPGYQDPSGGYPPPGAPGGYPPPGGYQDQTGGYQAAGYQQGGYGPQPGGYGPQPGSATGAPPSGDERQMALFAHLGGGILGFLVPLIIYLIKRDESPFIRDQSAQALNFQLLILIGYVVSSILSIIVIGGILGFVCWVASVVFGILGGVAANKGEWYRYPFNVSWVK